MAVEITNGDMIPDRSRLFCPMEQTMTKVFFSLVDYRNNYFTSDDPNKIIEFYNGFENRDQLIQWMRERPKGVANIHEVDGDKDIIVVIPTADFNGKYARECRENIFKGLHIVFVESGGKGDFYFNYAQNCNVGIRKAMEYNPKWVVVSNDDMKAVNNISTLVEELNTPDLDRVDLVLCKKRMAKESITYIGKSTFLRSILFHLYSNYTKNIKQIETVFSVNIFSHGASILNKIIYRKNLKLRAVGDFAILNYKFIKHKYELFDPVFINGNEDIDVALQLFLEGIRFGYTKFNIESVGGGSLGRKGRILKDLAGLIYLNYKIERLYNSKINLI